MDILWAVEMNSSENQFPTNGSQDNIIRYHECFWSRMIDLKKQQINYPIGFCRRVRLRMTTLMVLSTAQGYFSIFLCCRIVLNVGRSASSSFFIEEYILIG